MYCVSNGRKKKMGRSIKKTESLFIFSFDEWLTGYLQGSYLKMVCLMK